MTRREHPAPYIGMYIRFLDGGLFPGLDVDESVIFDVPASGVMTGAEEFPKVYHYVIRKESEPNVKYEYILNHPNMNSRWRLTHAWKTDENTGDTELLMSRSVHLEYRGDQSEYVSSDTLGELLGIGGSQITNSIQLPISTNGIER